MLAALAAGAVFACQPVSVWDGDSLTCASGVKVRVAGIAARELRRVKGGGVVDAGCRPGHPCPAVDGVASRDALARLVSAKGARPVPIPATGHLLVNGPALQCTSTGGAGRKRTGAFCSSPVAGDLSCAMIRGGYALRWDRYWRGHRC